MWLIGCWINKVGHQWTKGSYFSLPSFLLLSVSGTQNSSEWKVHFQREYSSERFFLHLKVNLYNSLNVIFCLNIFNWSVFLSENTLHLLWTRHSNEQWWFCPVKFQKEYVQEEELLFKCLLTRFPSYSIFLVLNSILQNNRKNIQNLLESTLTLTCYLSISLRITVDFSKIKNKLFKM